MLLRSFTSFLALNTAIVSHSFANDNFYYNGFVSLGFAQESENNFLANDKDNFTLVEIGLKLSYELNDNFTLTGQLAHRRFGEFSSDSNIRIDYALIAYSTKLTETSEQSVSLGRVKTPIGLYNLSRDVPLSRPSIILSQGVYLDIFRNLMMSSDGINLSSRHNIGGGSVSLTLAYGGLNVDDNFSDASLGGVSEGEWEAGTVLSADMRFNTHDFILGLSYNDLHPKYKAAAGDTVPGFPIVPFFPGIDGGIAIKNYTAFLQKSVDKFEFSAEYSYKDVRFDDLVPLQPFPSKPMEGYYAQLRYFASPKLSLTARWDRFYRDADNKDGVTVVGDIPRWINTSTTQTFSAVYNINESWTLMGEIHFVDGVSWLPPFSNAIPESLESRKWSLTAFQLTYSF